MLLPLCRGPADGGCVGPAPGTAGVRTSVGVGDGVSVTVLVIEAGTLVVRVVLLAVLLAGHGRNLVVGAHGFSVSSARERRPDWASSAHRPGNAKGCR